MSTGRGPWNISLHNSTITARATPLRQAIPWAFARVSHRRVLTACGSSVGRVLSDGRDREIRGRLVAPPLDELRGAFGEEPQDELRPAHPLAAELDREIGEVEARRIDVRSVAQAQLDVERRRERGSAPEPRRSGRSHPGRPAPRRRRRAGRCRPHGCSPRSATERSVETLIVVAPSSSSTRAVAPFAHGSKTEVLSTRSGGRSPAARMLPRVASTPRSPTRNDRMPCSRPRRTSATHCSTPAVPRAMAPTARREGATARPCPRHRAGRGTASTSTPRSAPSRAISSELDVGQHHHPGPLRHPAHRHAARVGLLEHRAHDRRPFDRRDLDAVAETVGEAGVAHGVKPCTVALQLSRTAHAQNSENATGSLGSARTSRTRPPSMRNSSI